MNSFAQPMRNPTIEPALKPEFTYVPTEDADVEDFVDKEQTWDDVVVIIT